MKRKRQFISFIVVLFVLLCGIVGSFYLIQEGLNSETVAIDKGNISNSWLREAIKKQIDKNHDNILTKIEREAVSELKLYIGGGTTVELPELNLFPNLKVMTLEIGGDSKTINLNNLKYIEKLHIISLSLNKSSIQCTGARRLTFLKVTAERKEYSTAIQIENCPAIKELQTEGGGVTDLELSAVPVMEKVMMRQAAAASLNFHQLPKLEEVILYDTIEMQKLTLYDLPKLENVDLVTMDKLSQIGLKNLPDIKEFRVLYAKELHYIDFSKIPNLKKLILNEVPLKQLDFSDCKQITEIEADSISAISRLNLKQQKQLERLEWNSGNLREIKWGKKEKLESIVVNRNKLSGTLNLSDFPELRELEINHNSYDKLLGRKHKEIENIKCDHNQLKLIDLGFSENLNWITGEGNPNVTVYLPKKREEEGHFSYYDFDPKEDIGPHAQIYYR